MLKKPLLEILKSCLNLSSSVPGLRFKSWLAMSENIICIQIKGINVQNLILLVEDQYQNTTSSASCVTFTFLPPHPEREEVMVLCISDRSRLLRTGIPTTLMRPARFILWQSPRAAVIFDSPVNSVEIGYWGTKSRPSFCRIKLLTCGFVEMIVGYPKRHVLNKSPYLWDIHISRDLI